MKLRVSSIDSSINRDQLQMIFSRYGEVDSVKIFRGLEQTAPTCLGFVEMENEENAKKAMKKLHGKKVGGFSLQIELSHDTVRVKNRNWKPISLDDDDDDEFALSTEVMYEASIGEDIVFDDD